MPVPLIRRLPMLAAPVALLGVWWLVVAVVQPEAWLLPAPDAVAQVLWEDRGRLWFHAQATIAAAGLGLVMATVLGGGLAIAIASLRPVERSIYPWVVASQAVPLLALAPLIAVWLDYGVAQLMVAFLVSFFPVVVTGVDGLRAVDPDLGRAMRTLGAGQGWVFRRVTLPAALPHLFSGLKMAAVFSVTGAVVAEYVGADRGLGYLSEFTTAQFRTAESMAAIVLLALIGICFFFAVALIERLLMPHRRHSTRPTWRTR